MAGRICVAAVAMPKGLKLKAGNVKLKDSKKLTPRQREIWLKHIKNNKNIHYSTALVSANKIDKINISKAANLAAEKAFNRLIANRKARIASGEVFLDGGLYLKAPNHKSQITKFKQQTIIKGDEKIPVVALASIVAKVCRDKEMVKLHKKYPEHNFAKHKGYGTKEHFKSIKIYGPSPIHRLTFLKKMIYIKQ